MTVLCKILWYVNSALWGSDAGTRHSWGIQKPELIPIFRQTWLFFCLLSKEPEILVLAPFTFPNALHTAAL